MTKATRSPGTAAARIARELSEVTDDQIAQAVAKAKAKAKGN